MWRLSNLYKIIVKQNDDDDSDGLVMTFKPNRAQRRLLARMHNRNIILKARQMGFTTLICILWLDTALFSKQPIQCGIIAQDLNSVEKIFRDKVKFAYDNLPDALRMQFPLDKDTSNELVFAHNHASIAVGMSMRSGTYHRLHVSEFGKICAQSPQKAKEVVTGSIPTVPTNGICIIESTAEGQDGHFYKMTKRAQALFESDTKLSKKDWRFHFYAWWESPDYTLDDECVFSESDLEYFTKVEAIIGRPLTEGQRTWYVMTRRNEFSDEAPLMWQEYPSYPDEAFQVSTEGCFYSTQLTNARLEKRIVPTIPVVASAVNTFWDIGRGDMTAIWFHQRVGMENRFIRYYEASGEDLNHYVKYLQDTGYTFGTHYIPHETDHKRMGETPDTNRSIKEMLENLMPGQNFKVVPRVTAVITGIQATRNAFGSCWFSEAGCGDGIKRLGNYRKKWDSTNGRFTSEPMHDDNSHGADAFRQFGQEADAGNQFPPGGGSGFVRKQSSRWRRNGTPMAV